jgi:glycosyltransferase involved in cell wall biosynthesis
MEEGWRYVARAAVAVSPFYPIPILRSTSPTKLVEYMAMGKPVVANDHPEQRKVIVESGGGICVAYDEAAFADAVVELLSNPDKASIMGRRGRRYVEEYRSYAVLADQVEQRYLELCQGIPEMLDSN